jgi:uracil-DNA glycosylase family 4
MDHHLQAHYQALGILRWQQRQNPPVEQSIGATDWHDLANTVSQCTRCNLHKTRTQTVFGVGNHAAKLMVIGEAPGFHEDQQGEPFVGRAGLLLTAMLKSIGFTRNDVYIANVLKCRPPNNRDPLPDEVALCTNYLDQQIALVKPQLLLGVGRVAAHYLLKTKASLESMRHQLHHYGIDKRPLIITYHPAYLLRKPQDKKKAYIDLQCVKKTLALLE